MNMKHAFKMAVVLTVGSFFGCTSEDSEGQEFIDESTGSISGLVTALESTEPLRGAAVSLVTVQQEYRDSMGLMNFVYTKERTLTFDDGHYELKGISPGHYSLVVVSDDYNPKVYPVDVNVNQECRADIQMEKFRDEYMMVQTKEVLINGESSVTINGSVACDPYPYYGVNIYLVPYEVGFLYSESSNVENYGSIVKTNCEDFDNLKREYYTGRIYKYDNPAFDGDILKGSFSTSLSNLPKGKYYVKAYAKRKADVEYKVQDAYSYSEISSVEYGELRTFEVK